MADTSTRQFQTASARRKGVPVKFTIEHWVTPEPPADYDATASGEWEPEPVVIVRTMMVNPLVDVVSIGAAFAGLGALLKGFNSTDVDGADKLARLEVELPRTHEAMRNLLIPTHRTRWDDVKGGVDVQTLGELVRWITTELSGLDPTRPTSSSDGSTSTSGGSTDGAPPAEST